MYLFLTSLKFPRWTVVCTLLSLLTLTTQAKNPALAVTTRLSVADVTVTGQVTDAATGEALAGCSVVVKGTQRGTTTDANGNYRLSVPNGNVTLVFGFIGFVSQEVVVGNQTAINVGLKSSASELNQVVVIGYGSTTKRDMTGSIKSIKSADFNRGIINSPEQLIQGKIAGVNVTSASGEPGSNQTITIRGPGGIRSGSTPLFVLDGLPLDNSSTGGATNPLTFLNPNDIESIDVLKDASATSIYGARGANGVVLITTKKGKSGTSNLTLSTSVGISKMARPLNVLNANDFRQGVTALGGVLDDRGASTDWQKVVSRTAITQNYNLGFNGGSQKLTYFGSVGVQSQQGILKNSQLNRYTGRINVTQQLLEDRLSLDVNLNAAYTDNQRPPIGNLIGSAIAANPTYPAYDSTGAPFQYQGGVNPIIALNLNKDATATTRVIANISPSFKILKNLVYKLNVGLDYSNATQDIQSLAKAVPQQDGRLDSYYTNNRNTLVENYFTYTLNRGNNNLTALLGHSYQKFFIQG